MKKKDEEKSSQKRIEELETQVKRTLADYQNLEKRTEAQRKDWIRSSNRDLILRLLPVLDTLILAGKHVEDEGLKLSIKQFQDIFEKEGVQRIETLNQQFDPHTMECVETQEGEEGKVLQELRPGYKLFDKVLRPAQVKVGKSHKETKEEEEAKQEQQRGDYM